ncbi:hypothetical protein IAT38_003910 [Cryptococcus sp. DSM 104549]
MVSSTTPTTSQPSDLKIAVTPDADLATPPLSPATSSVNTPLQTPKAVRIPSFPPPTSFQSSLHAPLKAHLGLLHPSTPTNIVTFCAARLLSPDRPYGFEGRFEWKPIHLQEGGFDLQTSGVGKDAGKELRESQSGPGKEADEKVEKMYAAARKSYTLLELKGPSRGSAL